MGTPAQVNALGGVMDQPQTIAEAVIHQADSTSIGLIAGDLRLTHAEVVVQAARRAAWLHAHRSPGPFHVAVLLENVPEFIFWLEAAALAGAVVVGANPTHRGDELIRDLSHTECQLLVTDSGSLPLLDGASVGGALGTVRSSSDRVLVLDSEPAQQLLETFHGVTPADWATSCSRREHRAHRRRACARRADWRASAASWLSGKRSPRRMSATSPCLSSIPTR
jgi:acyl-CoA synthetase (AMP-forming)/AMP-acid ligase II